MNEPDARFSPGEKARLSAEPYITYEALERAILLSMREDEPNRNLFPELQGKKPTRSVVLLDEIDKAPRDLPNDVLNEIENMTFRVKETGRTFTADPDYKPVLVLTIRTAIIKLLEQAPNAESLRNEDSDFSAGTSANNYGHDCRHGLR